MKKEYLEFDNKTIEKIEEITLTDYGFVGCKIQTDKCIDIIEDLLIYYEDLQEEYNAYQEREIIKYDIEH